MDFVKFAKYFHIVEKVEFLLDDPEKFANLS
jgi:hypothetical protein